MKKKLLALAISLTACISLFGCGGKETSNMPEFVYVPTYQALELEESVNMWDSQLIGTNLYYTEYTFDEETGVGGQNYYVMDLANGATPQMLNMNPKQEGEEFNQNTYTIDADGNMYAVGHVYEVGEEGVNYTETPPLVLRKVSKDGELLFSEDISSHLVSDDREYLYIQYCKVDDKGRMYLGQENGVYVFDENGGFLGYVEVTSDWMNGMYALGGKVYAGRYSADYNSMELCEINPETKQVGNVLTGIPSNGNIMVTEAEEGKIIIASDNNLVSYDLATMEKEEILNWIDCDVPGYSVTSVMYQGEGKYLVLLNDYTGEEEVYELVTLTKTKSSEVPQKKVVTMGTMYGYNSDLQKAIVDFNKTNGEYRVSLKTYIDENAEWTDTTYSDAVARLNNDITSGNGPDIVDLSNVSMENYAAKGLLEDWTPYLEKSTVISKEDFHEGIINAYTINDKLLTIPTGVYIGGFMGKEEVLGQYDTWTINDMIALSKDHPEADLLSYGTKDSILQVFMYAAADSYIDYETGTCNFNGEDFLSLLEFANTFPKEYEYVEGESFPSKIRAGECLLADVSFYSMEEYQMYQLMFDCKTRVVGFPSKEGDGKLRLQGENCYGICSKSKNKDGAFAFLETLLTYEEYTRYGRISGFPSRKDMMEEMFTLAMTPEYQLDENGEKVLDENGEPITYPKTTWGWDDFEAEIYEATQEQVDFVKSMLDNCTVMSTMDQELMKIISEEATPYFEGQKSAKEAADIIQSRVSIYVSENM